MNASTTSSRLRSGAANGVRFGHPRNRGIVASNRPPLAFLSINTQFENVGDALINRELIRLLAARTTATIDLSRSPRAFAETMGIGPCGSVHTLHRFGYLRLLARMLRARLRGRACYFFLNPGGLGGRLSGRKALAMIANNLLLGALGLVGIRLALVGVSFEEMGPRERFLWQWRCKLLRILWVRDEITSAYVSSLGIRVDAVVPDLSFGLYNDAVRDRSRTTSCVDAVAFSFRFDKADADQALRALVDHIVDVQPEDVPIRFVAQVERDVAPMTALYDHVRARIGDRASIHIATDDIEACLTSYRTCRALYSNRLHALLMSAFAGAAPCAVLRPRKANKFEGIFSALHLTDEIHWLDESPMPTSLPRCPEPQALIVQVNRLEQAFDELIAPQLRGRTGA